MLASCPTTIYCNSSQMEPPLYVVHLHVRTCVGTCRAILERQLHDNNMRTLTSHAHTSSRVAEKAEYSMPLVLECGTNAWRIRKSYMIVCRWQNTLKSVTFVEVYQGYAYRR